MAIRMDDDDYNWVLARNLRGREMEDADTVPRFSDRLVEWATVVAGFAGVMLLIDAVVIALR